LAGGGGGGRRLGMALAVLDGGDGRGGNLGGAAGFGLRGGGELDGMGCEIISMESSMFMLSLFPPSDDRETDWKDEMEEVGICLVGRIGG
jgi:hypothetical protein